ncbi:MAG: ABC transporter permease [Thermoguttaceae bacterium]|nr:ABC transporter permease [Thermoguttaceae bacterium]
MFEKKTISIEETTFWEKFTSYVGSIGRWIADYCVYAGNLAVFSLSTLFWLFAKPPRRDGLTSCFYNIGVLSLPVVMLTGAFIGMVLAIQTYPQFKLIGLESHIGAAINLSLVKELGPVLAATMLAGRVGSSIAAELGTMRVTEQIDALSSMGVNPIHYLVVPRFVACLILIPGLTLFADLYYLRHCFNAFYLQKQKLSKINNSCKGDDNSNTRPYYVFHFSPHIFSR